LNKISFTNQLVLVGGGHANIQVLKELCMKDYKGLHTILINKEYHATYSGMTPGFFFNKFSCNAWEILEIVATVGFDISLSI